MIPNMNFLIEFKECPKCDDLMHWWSVDDGREWRCEMCKHKEPYHSSVTTANQPNPVDSSEINQKRLTCRVCGTELVCFDRYEHGGQKPGCPKCGKLDEDIVV